MSAQKNQPKLVKSAKAEHRYICLRVYLMNDNEAQLINQAACKAQKTKRPNISRFGRELLLEKARQITKGSAA